MSFTFQNLTDETRRYMVEEVKYDLQNHSLYLSDRLSHMGKSMYPDLLLQNIQNGNEETLAQALMGKFNPTYLRKKTEWRVHVCGNAE